MEDHCKREVVLTNPSLNSNEIPINNSASSATNNASSNGSSTYDDSYFRYFPPGWRFRPYDEELIVSYLSKKVLNGPLPPNWIKEVELYKYNPETLAENNETFGDEEWYFFTPRDRKYRNGERPNRAAGDGYWKATGADKAVKFNDVNVGYRKTLVFYRGKPSKGDKTGWIMHEYRVENPPKRKRVGNDMRLDDWVLCRIYKKADKAIRVPTRQRDNPNQTQQADAGISANQCGNKHVLVEDTTVLSRKSKPFHDTNGYYYSSQIVTNANYTTYQDSQTQLVRVLQSHDTSPHQISTYANHQRAPELENPVSKVEPYLSCERRNTNAEWFNEFYQGELGVPKSDSFDFDTNYEQLLLNIENSNFLMLATYDIDNYHPEFTD